jgi:hypothetical protein
MHRTLALITLLGTSPLLCSALASALPGAPAAASSAPTTLDQAAQRSPFDTLRRAEPNAPATPMPMNLPDDATAEEIQGEYAIGIASLILGTLFVAALMLGTFYIVERQSWSAQH